jgi:hypothetical protein
MPLVKDLTTKQFLKVDKKAYELLSNNGILVYLAFVNAHPNTNPTDDYMAGKSGMGLSRYKTAKAELIEHEFLYVQRLGAKGAIIVYHFGKKAVKGIREKLDKKLDYSKYEKVEKEPFLEKVKN